jgi:hypothetical protein
MMPSRDLGTVLRRKSLLAIMLVGGAIAAHALIVIIVGKIVPIIAGIFAPKAIGQLAAGRWPPILELPLFGVFLASLAGLASSLSRLGLLLWTSITTEACNFSPFAVSVLLGPLSLRFSIFLWRFTLMERCHRCYSLAFDLSMSGFAAVVATFPIVVATGITIAIYADGYIKANRLIRSLLGFCIGMELLWLLLVQVPAVNRTVGALSDNIHKSFGPSELVFVVTPENIAGSVGGYMGIADVCGYKWGSLETSWRTYIEARARHEAGVLPIGVNESYKDYEIAQHDTQREHVKLDALSHDENYKKELCADEGRFASNVRDLIQFTTEFFGSE